MYAYTCVIATAERLKDIDFRMTKPMVMGKTQYKIKIPK